jgi:hypothetical protein
MNAPAPGAGAPPPARLIALAVALGTLLAIAFALRPHGLPAGNRLVVINAGARALDSVVVESEPPGANLLAGHAGYVAARDSLWLALPRASGDADVRIFRGGAAVAHHAVYFGGNSVFEVRVGDRDQLGRYRRTGG